MPPAVDVAIVLGAALEKATFSCFRSHSTTSRREAQMLTGKVALVTDGSRGIRAGFRPPELSRPSRTPDERHVGPRTPSRRPALL
jgi:hypothetical protein